MTTELTPWNVNSFSTGREQSIAFVDLMTIEQIYDAEAIYRAFLTNKPNPPEHVDYMKRAAYLYPALPPGAQQNALHCLQTLGKSPARRYVGNANARQAQNERYIMGTTLNAWRAKRSDVEKTYHPEGVCTWSPKRRLEHAEFVNRYNDYMIEGKAKAAQVQARARNKAERRLAAEIAAVAMPDAVEKAAPVTAPIAAPKTVTATSAKIDSTLVADLVALLKSEKGATYAEAAAALKIVSKGDKPHQSPAAQVRALVRDKVRPVHQIVASEHNSERGGAVYRLQN